MACAVSPEMAVPVASAVAGAAGENEGMKQAHAAASRISPRMAGWVSIRHLMSVIAPVEEVIIPARDIIMVPRPVPENTAKPRFIPR